MAPRTLASTWRQLEKLSRSYHAAEDKAKFREAIDDLVERANKSKIGGGLATLFVNGFDGLEESDVVFIGTNCEGVFPEWTVSFDAENNVFSLNPVGIVGFVDECQDAAEELKDSEARFGDLDGEDEELLPLRLKTCLGELSKLPSQMHLFIQLLCKVAQVLRVTQVEKRGGGKYEIEDERYMTLTWAFKELERIYRDFKGINLRSEYLVLWYESDWFTGSK